MFGSSCILIVAIFPAKMFDSNVRGIWNLYMMVSGV